VTDEAQQRIAALEQLVVELQKALSAMGERVTQLVEENQTLRRRLEGKGGGGSGGSGGGTLVVAGTPEDIAAHPGSHTGRYLKALLARS